MNEPSTSSVSRNDATQLHEFDDALYENAPCDRLDRKLLDGVAALGANPADCFELSFLISGIFDPPRRPDDMIRRVASLAKVRDFEAGARPHDACGE